MQQILTTIAGVVFFAGYFPYIFSIVRGNTKPTKASWIIWAIIDAIIIAGMVNKHTLNGQMVGAILGSGTIMLLSFRYGVPGWTKVDIACLIGAPMGLLLWYIFQEANFGIVAAVIVIFLGSIPTFTSAWHHPERENKSAWALYWLGCLLAMGAIPAWTVADALQPVSFTITETVMMYLLWIHPHVRQ